MMHRTSSVILFALLSCVTAFGQTGYKGLTPRQSTKADVERVLGQSVNNISKTLVEYKSPEGVGQLFVQYRDESPTAIVERIEHICLNDGSDAHDLCGPALYLGQLRGVLEDAFSNTIKQEDPLLVRYYGAPRFMVWTLRTRGINSEYRLAYYSKSLYESVVPKGGCTGTIFGTWQTERDRVTVVREGDDRIRGTYAKNNGSFSLKHKENGYVGEWKDDTGSGTMALLLDGDSFRASLSRGSAASASPNQPSARPGAGAKLGSVIEEIKKSGSAAAVGTIIDEPSEPRLSGITGLPPGEPLTGKCVP